MRWRLWSRELEAEISRDLHKALPLVFAAPETAAFYGRISTLSIRVAATFLLSFLFIEDWVLKAISGFYASFAFIIGQNYHGQLSPEGELTGVLIGLAVVCAYIPAVPPALVVMNTRTDVVRRCLTILPFFLLSYLLLEWTGSFLDIEYLPGRLYAVLLCMTCVAVMSACVARLRF